MTENTERQEPSLDTSSQDIRAQQEEILRRLDGIDVNDSLNIEQLADVPNMERHIRTLEGNGLIAFNDASGLDLELRGFAQITAKGRAYIGTDGGLGSDLNVVTVKLHDESLQLIEAWIRLSNLKPTEREKWIRMLRDLPRESTKHLVLELVKMGLGRPEALSTIQTLLHSVPQ